jgi:ribosomal protein L13
MDFADVRLYRSEYSLMQIINGEIVKVTGTMRRNKRWSIDQQSQTPNLMENAFLKIVSEREPSGLVA